jgi:hypothetical protein
MPVEVAADLSKHSLPDLWRVMDEKHWLHLYDQFGKGPHDPVDLPESVRGLADDPYRSVAWAVRQAGGYNKTEAVFSEFTWAEFFRKNLKVHPIFDDWDRAVKQAMELAAGPACSKLPGYCGKA